jgi:molecular chaperone GrpE
MPKKPVSKKSAEEALLADLQRVQADFVNFKRRSEEERMRAVSIGKEDVLHQMLPVIDNLERALGHTPKELANNDWAKGVANVAKQLKQTLQGLGLAKIPTVGQHFDPSLHEAVAVEGEGSQELVAEELRPGYILNDYVLRPSMVRVKREK